MLRRKNKTSLTLWDHQEHQVKVLATQKEFLSEERPLKTTISNKEKFKHFMDIELQLKYFQMCLNLTNLSLERKVKMKINKINKRIMKTQTM